jgi:hypothetical protein
MKLSARMVRTTIGKRVTWHVRLTARNGKIVAHTEKYASRRNAYRLMLALGELGLTLKPLVHARH